MGVIVYCEDAGNPDRQIRVRTFAPGLGIPEDPVSGSGNGCVGAYRARAMGATGPLAYRAEQGVEMGRRGFAEVEVSPVGGQLEVRIGGKVSDLLRGELRL